jgi:hypothetical protein
MPRTAKLAAETKPPKGWFISGADETLFHASVDTTNPHSGTKCAHLRNSTKLKNQASWGTLMQEMDADKFLGKRIRMSLWVKTKNVPGHVQPWMRVDGRRRDSISFDNMCTRSITGTTDWAQHSIVLDVPGESNNIAFGIMLGGEGDVWLDDVVFEVVADDVPVTDCPCSSNVERAPQNLNFEEGEQSE